MTNRVEQQRLQAQSEGRPESRPTPTVETQSPVAVQPSVATTEDDLPDFLESIPEFGRRRFAEGERAATQRIIAYLRDGKRIGGSKDTQLLAHVIADYIERGEHEGELSNQATEGES